MANFGPLTTEIGSGVWAPQQISTGFASWLRYCSGVAHRRPTKLCTMFGRLLAATLYIHFRGLLPPNGSLPGAKFTFPLSFAFSYIGSVTARHGHSSSGRRPNFAAWRGTRNGITELSQRAPPIFGRALGIGPHFSLNIFQTITYEFVNIKISNGFKDVYQ